MRQIAESLEGKKALEEKRFEMAGAVYPRLETEARECGFCPDYTSYKEAS